MPDLPNAASDSPDQVFAQERAELAGLSRGRVGGGPTDGYVAAATKGGQRNTTYLTASPEALALLGRKVLVVDLDDQGSCPDDGGRVAGASPS